MPCNHDVEHSANSSLDLSEFISNSYFHLIEFGLEVSKGSPQVFDSFLVSGHSAKLLLNFLPRLDNIQSLNKNKNNDPTN